MNTISSTSTSIRVATCGRLRASFIAGMTTVTVGRLTIRGVLVDDPVATGLHLDRRRQSWADQANCALVN